MGGCDPFATGTVGASVTGTVVNTTGLGIDSAQVTLLRDGSTVRQVRSRSDGSYSIEGVDGGTYSLQYSAVGYASRTVETSVDADESLQAAVGTDTLIGPASVSGRVLDSQTGDGVGGATVLFSVRPDAETRAVALKAVLNRASASAQQLVTSPDFITTTDETGRYEIAGMPTGEAARTVRDSGSLDETTRDIDIEEGSNELDPATLPDEVEEGSFRIVLNWGQAPEDLDAHLKGPGSSGERYHTYWNDQSAGNAEHNQDATDGTGPETITISDIGDRDGLYRYSVQNYSDRTPSGGAGIASSPAEVEIYDSDGLVKSYTAPPTGSEEGSAWRVFEILATDGTLSIDDGGGETLRYRSGENLLGDSEEKLEIPDTPEDLTEGAVEKNEVQVFRERSIEALSESVPVDLSGEDTGEFYVAESGDLPEDTLSQGVTVTSYILHPDPVDNNSVTTFEGSQKFTGEILAVIMNENKLRSSDDILGSPDTEYQGSGGSPNSFSSDGVKIRNDGMTIEWEFRTGPGMDQVRVITER